MRLPPALRPLWPQAKHAYTVGTRLLAPATTALSRARGGYLPTHAVQTLDEALAAPGGGQLHVLDEGEVLERAVPSGHPAGVATFAQQTRAVIARQAVATLPAGRVLGPHRAVITRDGALVHELTRYFGTSRPQEHPLFLHPFVAAPTDLDGTVGVLASRGDSNYYHFLTDVLPRLATVERCTAVDAPQRWYVPAATRFQRELLAMVGLGDDVVVDAAAVDHIRAETLVVPTVPDLDLNTPPWLVDFLRERLLPAGAELVPGRHVYVTRGTAPHTRILRNEAAVLRVLEGYGFAVVDPGSISVADQIRTFAEADTIVAPHGAALANLAFASPGAAVLELFAPDFVQGCYWKLADCVPGLAYRYLVGSGRAPRRGAMNGVASDITVDVSVLERQLDELWSARNDVVPGTRA